MSDFAIAFCLIWVVSDTIFGLFCQYIAKEKNREGGTWFFLGFFFQLIALIAIAAIPAYSERRTVSADEIWRLREMIADEVEDATRELRGKQDHQHNRQTDQNT